MQTLDIHQWVDRFQAGKTAVMSVQRILSKGIDVPKGARGEIVYVDSDIESLIVDFPLYDIFYVYPDEIAPDVVTEVASVNH